MSDLQQEEAFMSEVYAVKILMMCVMKLVFDSAKDRQQAASQILDLASNSIAHFELKGADQGRVSRVHAAMQERVEQMVASALNPGSLPQGHS